jgi:hypothetical protein
VRMRPDSPALLAVTALLLAAGCSPDTPTSPAVPPMAVTSASHIAPTTTGVPTGERIVGKAAIEPAYNADSGALMYLLTPEKAPLPSHANGQAVSPLYLVVYPPDWNGATLNCQGIPGNCPDHDAAIAGAAMQMQSAVYGTDINAVPGHDHIGDPPGKPAFNIAWDVVVAAFTPAGVAHWGGVANLPHLTTDTAILDAADAGYVQLMDLGFAFNCSVVPASLYWKGTPVGG